MRVKGAAPLRRQVLSVFPLGTQLVTGNLLLRKSAQVWQGRKAAVKACLQLQPHDVVQDLAQDLRAAQDVVVKEVLQPRSEEKGALHWSIIVGQLWVEPLQQRLQL